MVLGERAIMITYDSVVQWFSRTTNNCNDISAIALLAVACDVYSGILDTISSPISRSNHAFLYTRHVH